MNTLLNLFNALLTLFVTDYTVTCSGEFFDISELGMEIMEIYTDCVSELCFTLDDYSSLETALEVAKNEWDIDTLRDIKHTLEEKREERSA